LNDATNFLLVSFSAHFVDQIKYSYWN